MVQEIQTTQTGRGPEHAMDAGRPPSRRSQLHPVPANLTPDLGGTPNPVYRFPVEVGSHPNTSGRRDISLEDPVDVDAEGADGVV